MQHATLCLGEHKDKHMAAALVVLDAGLCLWLHPTKNLAVNERNENKWAGIVIITAATASWNRLCKNPASQMKVVQSLSNRCSSLYEEGMIDLAQMP